jgi:hypothetical protein
VGISQGTGVGVKRRHALALVTLAAVCVHVGDARAQTQALLITGLGAEPKYHQLFMSLGGRLSAALHDRFSLPDSNIVWLGEDSTAKARWYAGRSTAVNINHAVDRMAARAKPGDQIMIVLIGHGSGAGDETKFNIPGPDLTAKDFNVLLNRFGASKVAFLDLTSASGDVLGVLSGPGRIVITATKSAYERNETQFARFFVDALDKPEVADVDKDGRVSLLEAYRYAVTETRRSYSNDERLLTEHSQLDDDGNGKGSDLPDGRAAGDGVVSRRFFLDAGVVEARLAASDPQLAKLYAIRFATEDQIEALRQRKTSMQEDRYYAELETLMLTLARTQRDIRRMEGR